MMSNGVEDGNGIRPSKSAEEANGRIGGCMMCKIWIEDLGVTSSLPVKSVGEGLLQERALQGWTAAGRSFQEAQGTCERDHLNLS